MDSSVLERTSSHDVFDPPPSGFTAVPFRHDCNPPVVQSSGEPTSTTAPIEEAVAPDAVNSSGETSTTKNKKRTWKKPKGKPKRPLSAYNLFFKHERSLLVSSSENPEGAAAAKGGRRRHRKTHGKISFADLARSIAEKWKNLDDAARAVYVQRAEVEKARYKEAVKAWDEARKAKQPLELTAQEQRMQAMQPYAVRSKQPHVQHSRVYVSRNHPQEVVHPQRNQRQFFYSPYQPQSKQQVKHEPRPPHSLPGLILARKSSWKDSPPVQHQYAGQKSYTSEDILELTMQTIDMAKKTLNLPLFQSTSSDVHAKKPALQVKGYDSKLSPLICSKEHDWLSSFTPISLDDPHPNTKSDTTTIGITLSNDECAGFIDQLEHHPV